MILQLSKSSIYSTKPPPVRSMEDNSDIGAGGDNITNINTPTFIGSLRSSRNN
ncbi:hypothetical protein [Salmonella enterica]|uniref:hypothetical protein n=1 Tax=Salmonella enterica TaxID=28901 RepID=UPI00351DBEDB